MSRNILCVVEFDNYPQQVVARATWLAKLHGYNLHLLVSDPVTDFLGDSYVYMIETQHIADSIREYQEAAIVKLLTAVEEEGVSVDVSRDTDRHVAAAIRRGAAARGPAYVVKGTHLHSPSERASLGDADWDLIRDLDYPLWFVKPVDWHTRPVIVAAVDPVHAHDKPTYLDQHIIELAKGMADACGGALHVLHTYQLMNEIGSRVMWAFKPEKLPLGDLDTRIREEHAHALKVLGEVSGVRADSLHLVPGQAHEVLPAFAREKDAGLVVMGALARSRLKQRFVGSTAARVLDHIPCDVLVVHAR